MAGFEIFKLSLKWLYGSICLQQDVKKTLVTPLPMQPSTVSDTLLIFVNSNKTITTTNFKVLIWFAFLLLSLSNQNKCKTSWRCVRPQIASVLHVFSSTEERNLLAHPALTYCCAASCCDLESLPKLGGRSKTTQQPNLGLTYTYGTPGGRKIFSF